jgi:hypothetical protein
MGESCDENYGYEVVKAKDVYYDLWHPGNFSDQSKRMPYHNMTTIRQAYNIAFKYNLFMKKKSECILARTPDVHITCL